jgi:hypothetical protein
MVRRFGPGRAPPESRQLLFERITQATVHVSAGDRDGGPPAEQGIRDVSSLNSGLARGRLVPLLRPWVLAAIADRGSWSWPPRRGAMVRPGERGSRRCPWRHSPPAAAGRPAGTAYTPLRWRERTRRRGRATRPPPTAQRGRQPPARRRPRGRRGSVPGRRAMRDGHGRHGLHREARSPAYAGDAEYGSASRRLEAPRCSPDPSAAGRHRPGRPGTVRARRRSPRRWAAPRRRAPTATSAPGPRRPRRTAARACRPPRRSPRNG